jgi:hypothetical protein
MRRVCHTVHTPDLYNGSTFDDLAEGVAYAEEIGYGDVIERGVRYAQTNCPESLSAPDSHFGALSAQAE